MTKLEQQIIEAFKQTSVSKVININQFGNSVAEEELAQVAAKIALELAEKAYGHGWCKGHNDGIGYEDDSTFKQFIQDYE